MTEKKFAELYAEHAMAKRKPKDEKVPAGLNEAKETTSDPKVGKVSVTHPVDGGKKHPKIGCAWDAMGPYAGSGENGPFDGLADGEGAQIGEGGAGCCDGGAAGAACGESISPKQFNACLESICVEFPGASNVVEQIKRMFNDVHAGKSGKLYCGADGCEADTQECMVSDADAAISAAAASVEAALTTFRNVAGIDYEEFKKGTPRIN